MLIPDTTQTIVAPASGRGGGAVAMVRISGPEAFKTAAAFLKPSSVFSSPRTRFSYFLKAEENGRLLDNTVVTLYRAPKSYTGDDLAEISCHGSPYIVSRLLRLAIANGAREARPGEFTLRAFVNGKLDLAQAEAVNDLIVSEHEASHRAAITQVAGEVSARVRKLRADLVGLLGGLEARLDDADEELTPLDGAAFVRRAEDAAAAIKTLADSFGRGRYLKHGLRVTIAGAPNSGKSSLLNRLTGSRRAIVSPTAGTTRDTLEETLTLSGLKIIFTDTAGLDPRPRCAVEREGMRRALKALRTADVILWVRDLSRKPSPADLRVGEAVKRGAPTGADLITVFNKSDLPPARTKAETSGGVIVSCRTGAGLPGLKRLLVRDEKRALSAGSSAVITSARHYSALLNAHKELSGLGRLKDKRGKFPLELAAEHLRGALGALADILGETTADDVLAEIFANFCVGK